MLMNINVLQALSTQMKSPLTLQPVFHVLLVSTVKGLVTKNPQTPAALDISAPVETEHQNLLLQNVNLDSTALLNLQK